MSCVLDQRDAFIGEIEENDRSAHDAAAADHLRVNDVADAHQQEDQHLPSDALKADLAGEGITVLDCFAGSGTTAESTTLMPHGHGGNGGLSYLVCLFYFPR